MRDELVKALNKIDRPGDFCTSGNLPFTLPGLEVDGLGTIGFPLAKSQALKLIKLSRQAPYGKGTETVVDTDVRRTWELQAHQFQLTNPKWDLLIDSIIRNVQLQLGLENQKLTAHPYSLLCYEKGGFFLSHRDGEKLDSMVATLVVALPSKFEGGRLIVAHEGKQQEIEFIGASSGLELSYAAFYADCEHEVTPVGNGYRLCLIYNITLAKSRRKKGIAAPSYEKTTVAIRNILTGWTRDGEPQKIAALLEHRYTQKSLSLDNLKGIDRARAEVLFSAAEQAGCMVYLALVTLWEFGSAESDYDDYSYRRRDYRSSDEDTYGGDYEMGDIHDYSLTADHWSDPHGKRIQLGKMPLAEDEIVSEIPLEDGDPDDEEFEGYTGNTGMTLERWYHRAAIVIWPREIHYEVLGSVGTNASIGGLEQMIKQLESAPKANREVQYLECKAFAEVIIDSWQFNSPMAWQYESESTNRSVLTTLLCRLNEPELTRRFLIRVMASDSGIQPDKSFTQHCHLHGWKLYDEELQEVMAATADMLILLRNARFLRMLCRHRSKNADRIALCTRLCKQIITSLKIFDKESIDDSWREEEAYRAELLSTLVVAMLAVDALEPLSRLIDYSLANVEQYDLTNTHVTAIFSLEASLSKLSFNNSAVSRWLSGCRVKLEEITAHAPEKPTDYRRAHTLSCDCADCRELSRFLQNPQQKEYRFPRRKNLRQHLHRIIDSNLIDLTHETERTGSPYTLVCVKTTASYELALQIHERDLRNLSRIKSLEKKNDRNMG